jgi:hypothetical protein
MQTWSLKATPNAALAQADGLGFADVIVVDMSTATSGGILPGDPVTVMGMGSPAAAAPLIGVLFPWDSPNGPFHGPYALMGGMLSLSVTVPTTGGPGPFYPEGLLICSSITASGQRNPFGGEVCTYSDPTAPPPVAAPSLATLSAAVLASYTSNVPVANAYNPSQQVNVTYTQQVLSWTGVVTVWPPECLSDAASTNIANLIGGTVVKVVPPSPFSLAAAGPPPEVNGIQIVQNGVEMVAVAGEVAQQFALFTSGSTVAQIQAGILSCFKPVNA